MRLEGKSSAGFFPTPERVTDALCTLLAPPATGSVRALDPCCGPGVFLATIAATLGAESYGIEVHEERAAAARTRVSRVLCADALAVRGSHDAYGLLVLNPPYDHDDDARRLEHAFLRKCTPYLAPGGVLAFLIPQHRLGVSARYLAAWYEGLRLWRFPDPEYAAYRQIVVLARRKAASVPNPATMRRLLARETEELLPLVPHACPPFVIPASGGPAPRLDAGTFDPREAAVAAGAPWPALHERLWPVEAPRVQPLMPMKKGHVAQFGVAGLLHHCVLHDAAGRGYVVKGQATKEVVVTEEEDEEHTTRTEREVIRTRITLLDLQDGTCQEVGTGADDAGALTLPDFLERFGPSITTRILSEYRPLYTPMQRDLYAAALRLLRRRMRGAQTDVVRAVALALQQGRRGVFVSGEMGTGKTTLGAAAAYCAGARSVLVLCPPHLVRKWQREVLATVPGARVGIANSIGDLHRILALPRDRWNDGPLFTIMSRERAKLSYAWRPAVTRRPARGRATGGAAPVELLCCPDCGVAQIDAEGIPLMPADFRKTRRRCGACGAALWQADPTGPRRVALADYITRHLRGAYDLLVLDEVHEFKARGSAQGLAAASLAAAIPRTVALTGTLFGGLATSIFHLLYRLVPEVRAEFVHTDEMRWAALYGLIERVTRERKDAYSEDGAQSKRRAYLSQVREKPGIMPALIVRLVRDTAFLRLADVADDLPPYSEEVLLYPMEPAQAAAYGRLYGTLHAALIAALHSGGGSRLLGAYLQTLLAYPDTCWRAEQVTVRQVTQEGTVRECVLAQEPALDAQTVYPKEQGLLDLIRREALEGRRVLVYVTHTESRDITGRLAGLVGRAGFRVAVLKSDTVAAEKREEWVEKRVKEGIHALIVHPRCVQTGLDLLDFPTIVYHEVEYSTYVLRQASRRSWRIGQQRPVRVYFTAYEGTMQAQALALIARKLRASLMVDGELGEEGLSEFADEGDFFRDLARAVAAGQQEGRGGLEELFAAARAAAQEQEGDLLTEEERAAAASAARPQQADRGGAVAVTAVSLTALRDAFYAAGKPHHVPEAQLSLFDALDGCA
jgi:superfamily II DNA or RNA helicase